MALAAQGAQGQLAISATSTWDATAETYDFLSENIVKTPTRVGGQGIRGTRSRSEEQTRIGTYTVGGAVSFNVTPWILDQMLPRILGTAEAADDFALAETLPLFGMLFNRVTDTFEYTGCYVNSAVIKGAAGTGLIVMDLNILGKTEVRATSYGAIRTTIGGVTAGEGNENDPYVFYEMVFKPGGSAVDIISFELTIDNMLDARLANSKTVTSITPQDRAVSLKVMLPFDSTTKTLYDPSTKDDSATIVITGTEGLAGASTTFTLGTLWPVSPAPNIGGKNEITLPLMYQVLRDDDAGVPEINVTHDSTPTTA